MTSPTLFYDVTAEVLAVAVDALNGVLPPEHRHDGHSVVNGPPAIDEWEGCGHRVYAWSEVVTPSTTPPQPAAGVVLCSPPWPMIQVTVATWRCEPTIGDDRDLPSAEALDDAARLVSLDAFIVWNALAQWAVNPTAADDDDPDERDYSVAMGLSTPVPPSGGLVGWETRVVIIPTDPSCPTAALAPLPDGWLPEVVDPARSDAY